MRSRPGCGPAVYHFLAALEAELLSATLSWVLAVIIVFFSYEHLSYL
jgi:hypothetical protein